MFKQKTQTNCMKEGAEIAEKPCKTLAIFSIFQK